MTDLKISQFADGGAIQSTDEIAVVRSGVNTKVLAGTAAALDGGTGIGDAVVLEDVGGSPGLPVADASQLTNVPLPANGTVTDAMHVDIVADSVMINPTAADGPPAPFAIPNNTILGRLAARIIGVTGTQVLDFISTTQNHMLVRGASVWAGFVTTAFGRGFLALADAAASRTYLALTLAATAIFQARTTYTPVISFAGASVGITYTTQFAQWFRIGNMVTVSFNVVLSNKGSSTGTCQMTLPVAAGSAQTIYVTDGFSMSGASGLSGNLFAQISAGSNQLGFGFTGTGAPAVVANTHVTNTTQFCGTISYMVD